MIFGLDPGALLGIVAGLFIVAMLVVSWRYERRLDAARQEYYREIEARSVRAFDWPDREERAA